MSLQTDWWNYSESLLQEKNELEKLGLAENFMVVNQVLS